VRTVAETLSGYVFVFPVHMNPAVREPVFAALSDVQNVRLIEPLEYGEMARLISASTALITDSGGLQEEGAALGVPVIVVRNVTERPEGVDSGILVLAGTQSAQIIECALAILGDEAQLSRMRNSLNPYGDGSAGDRVAQAVAWRTSGSTRPPDWKPNGG